MPRLKNIQELRKLREEMQRGMHVRAQTGTRIIVGMGTCGIAAGARQVLQSIMQELDRRQIEAHVETTSCIGMCAKEPLVDIEQAGRPRVTYGNIQPDKVPFLIEEHLINGRIVQDWAVARLGPEGI